MMTVAPHYWVRVAPYDPRRGYVIRKYGVGGTLYQGGERPTWYKVPVELAEQLRDIPQSPGDPRSPYVFEVYSEEDRHRVDAIEEERVLVQMGIMSATAPRPALQSAPAMDLTQGDPKGVPVGMPQGRGAAVPQPLTADSPPPVVPRMPAPEAESAAITTVQAPGPRRRTRNLGGGE
jgi:hypothetical protein